MKIAIVHDQLQEFGGAERVLVALKSIFPNADVYTSFYNPASLGNHRKKFEGWKIYTSWASHVPFLNRLYSPLRFITPSLWESLDLTSYDLIISSSGSYMSKGVKKNKTAVHICYIHHPPRYLYNYETGSLNELQKYLLFRIYANLINHGLRQWDFISSQRPDYFIANSEETKKRVTKFYRRDATVIYPPVTIPTKESLHYYRLSERPYYLTVSRLQFAKHVDLIIKAANRYKFNLKVVGVGRDLNRLEKLAGPTVEFLSSVPDEQFKELFLKARAFLFASVDDEFGIAPVEAMGYGVPVIAYSSGGLKETVVEGKNGYLFEKFDENSLIIKIKKLESLEEKKYAEISANARKESEKYSFEIFRKKITNFIKLKTPQL